MQMHASARQFLVNQFGVAAFTCGADGGYTAKTFNLNIFPRSFQGSETRFTCQASSLEYLAQHRFDFNKMVYDGIPYLQLAQKRHLLQVRRPADSPPPPPHPSHPCKPPTCNSLTVLKHQFTE